MIFLYHSLPQFCWLKSQFLAQRDKPSGFLWTFQGLFVGLILLSELFAAEIDGFGGEIHIDIHHIHQ